MNNVTAGQELMIVAKLLTAKSAEKEVERLLKVLLVGSPFAGKAFAVGGYVRDEFRGEEAKDLDIVVEMKDGAKKLTHWVSSVLGSAVTTPYQMGAGYPIWQITFKESVTFKGESYKTEGAVIEFADTMKETFPDKDSRQRVTEFGTLKDDVERRDFSVNSLMKDLTTGELLDLTGVSKSDIEKGILRGNPGVDLDKIFSEDALRMLRLLRFHCKYDWTIPLSVLKTVKRNADRISIVSSERIMEELKKIMKLGKLHKAIRLMKVTGLLQYVFPEVHALQGVKQHPKHHSEGDSFRHSMLVLKNAKPTLEGQMSALLHDIGKPATQKVLADNITFYGHEAVGADIAEAILYRMKFEVKTIKTIKALVLNHMRPHFLGNVGEKGLRKFVRDIGDELLESLLDLAEADTKSSIPLNGQPHNYVPELRERIKTLQTAVPVSKKPVLDGKEIADILGVKPGPVIGKAVQFLLDLADEHAANRNVFTKELATEELLSKFKPTM